MRTGAGAAVVVGAVPHRGWLRVQATSVRGRLVHMVAAVCRMALCLALADVAVRHVMQRSETVGNYVAIRLVCISWYVRCGYEPALDAAAADVTQSLSYSDHARGADHGTLR